MKHLLPCILAAVVGLSAGWFTASPQAGTDPAVLNPQSGSMATAGSAATPSWTNGITTSRMSAPLETASDCREAILRPADGTHPLVAQALRDRAWRRWLEIDAAGALAFAETQSNRNWMATNSIPGDLFRVWIDLDVDSALAAFTQASPAMIDATRRTFFGHLAQIDPERAFEELDQPRWQDRMGAFDSTAKEVFSTWAARDPRSAADALKDWRVGDQHSYQFREADTAIAEMWASADPEAAWEYYGDRTNQDEARRMVASYLLQHNPLAVIAAIEVAPADAGTVSEEYHIGQSLQGIARYWIQRDPDSAIEFARARDAGDPLAREMLFSAAGQLATSEPERALDLLAESGSPQQGWRNRTVLRQAFVSLTAEGIENAMELYGELPAHHQMDALSGILTYEYAADPEAAIAQARSLLDDPDTARSENLLPALARALAWDHGGGAQDLGEVVEAIPELKDHIEGDLLGGWVRTDPEEAAAFIAERATNNGGGTDAGAMAELAFSRPEFTATWIETLPEGDLRNQAARALATNWTNFNPQAAAAWIEQLPEGPARENTRSALETMRASRIEIR